MNIVYLDAFTLNPDSIIDWSRLNSFGNFKLYDRVSEEEIVQVAEDASIILTNKVKINQNTIDHLPNLKLIVVTATGYNIVDVDYAKQKGILVANVPSYSSNSVAQHTFAFILALSNQVSKSSNAIHSEWPTSKDFCYGHENIIDLEGKTLGLIGLGDIGKKVAKIAHSFGMKIIGNSKSMQAIEGIELVEVDKIFEQSDFISLHCPLNEATNQIISSSNLNKMKKSAFIINTSRGGLINESDLAFALQNNVIAGAALDVLSVEPPQPENPLLNAPNCIITPHVAWGSKKSRLNLYEVILQNITSFQNGTPINIVNS